MGWILPMGYGVVVATMLPLLWSAGSKWPQNLILSFLWPLWLLVFSTLLLYDALRGDDHHKPRNGV